MEQYQPEPQSHPPKPQVSWAIRGTLILVILAIAAYITFYPDVFWYEPGLQKQLQGQRITAAVQNVLVRAIEAYRDGGGTLGDWTEKELLPALRTNETASQVLAYSPTGLVKSDAVLDGFQRPMQVKVAAGPPPGVLILSGGPDGRIGTSDDIVLRRVWSQPPASQPGKENSHEGSRVQRKPPAGWEHLDTYPSRF